MKKRYIVYRVEENGRLLRWMGQFDTPHEASTFMSQAEHADTEFHVRIES